MKNKRYKIIISGGGTGGHVFPAIAIADALKRLAPESEILFVGANGRLEMQKVPAAGYPIKGLNISGFQRKLNFKNGLKNIAFFFKLANSLWRSWRIIKQFKPDVVVGVGGYASGAVMFVAGKKGIPTLIQEQNSYPGITNKLLAGKAAKICVAYPRMSRFFLEEKIVNTGNPIRQDLLDLSGKRQQAMQHFALREGKTNVLVVGGSLGARSINESIHKNAELIENQDINMIWQTGKSYEPQVENFQAKNIKVLTFVNRMDLAYAAADVIVSRAGAISISELCAVGKPVILIPSPNVAEDHQTKNALALLENKAALLVKDVDARTDLVRTLFELIDNQQVRQQLSENISKLAKTDAAEHIAGEILGLV